jgi:dTDP-4-dehydrorhamnose 3,5-epimerase
MTRLLSGVIIKPLKRMPDERGTFAEVYRKDWSDLLGADVTAQANLSVTFPGIIRAWHRHLRGQTDYFLCLKGTLKIGIYDDQTGELNEIVSSAQNLQVVRVPGQFWHGFKAVGDEQVMLLYFTTKLYDPSNPDEERRAWNDSKLIPKSINGKTDDPRVGKAWDWDSPPHK